MVIAQSNHTVNVTCSSRLYIVCCLVKNLKMFYFIGLGLGDAKDITVKGLEIVKGAKRVYLEAYTSILTDGKEKLVRK